MRIGMPSARPFTRESREWEAMYHHHEELHQAVRTKKKTCTWNQKANPLWAMRAAKDGEDKIYHPTHQKNIPERTHPNPLGVVGRTLEKSSRCSSEGAGMFGVE